jgi:protoporphyrinogen oxidase
VVTRDVVPAATWRAFTFHFRPGLPEAERLERVGEVLGVTREAIEHVARRRTVLPSPTVGHHQRVAALDARLAAEPGLAVVGNWFAGLSIEDCAQRARAEWQRLKNTD